jgi:hypothetical protein
MLFVSRSDDIFKSALDCNGFPLDTGDLVEMTGALDERNKGAQGIVTRVANPNICYVQMERPVSITSTQSEVVAAAGFLWKLVSKGAS